MKEPPVFNGDPFEFPSFVTAFDAIISENVPTDRDRLYFLEKYTTGKANDVVSGFLSVTMATAYQEARKLLEARFGNPIYVVEDYKSKLLDWPQVSEGNSVGLREFSDFLIRCEEAAKSIGAISDLDSTQVLRQVSAKLPSYSGVKWCRHAHDHQTKKEKRISFHELVKFVKEEAELANDPVFSPDALRRERQKSSGKEKPVRKPRDTRGSSSTHATSTSSPSVADAPRSEHPSQAKTCLLCDSNHPVSKCQKFLSKTLEARVEFIRKNNLCFKCFKGGHVSSRCKSSVSCDECGKRHNTLLHGAKPKSKKSSEDEKKEDCQPVPESTDSNVASVTHSSTANHQLVTNSMIVPLSVYHKDNPRKEVQIYALIDDASDTTF